MTIIILHNPHDKSSREFVTANPSYDVIDWYGNSRELMEYKAEGKPSPSGFPSVVDIDEKYLVINPATMADALNEINTWIANADNRQWDIVRTQRDNLLKESDWTQATDAPLTAEKVTEWQTYRQVLRDIPQVETDPYTIIWVEKPV